MKKLFYAFVVGAFVLSIGIGIGLGYFVWKKPKPVSHWTILNNAEGVCIELYTDNSLTTTEWIITIKNPDSPLPLEVHR